MKVERESGRLCRRGEEEGGIYVSKRFLKDYIDGDAEAGQARHLALLFLLCKGLLDFLLSHTYLEGKPLCGIATESKSCYE